MSSLSHITTAPAQAESALVARLFSEIAQMTPDVKGVSRPAFSEIETRTLEYLEDFARSEGLDVWYDAGRNANFCLPGDRKADSYIVVGSHVDSVPFGGNYDGMAGVIAGLLCLVRARRAGQAFRRPVHVLAMRGEESAWFGPCYVGSKALTGQLAVSEMQARHKGDGRTLAEHMAGTGLPVERIAARTPLIDCSRIEAYLELHIEQGPLLIGKDLPAAVVSGIRGNFRHRSIKCIGEAGHSGAVPKAYRKDPVLAFADLMVRLDESWTTILNKGDDLVLTSGVVSTDPDTNAMSRIPDRISFSLDVRSQSSAALEEMRNLLRTEMTQIEKDRKVRFEFDGELSTTPATCDPALVSGLQAAMASTGLQPFVMPSGGGHDAAVFAAAGVPSGMVFVRNRNGSHNPDEDMDVSDFLAACSIIYTFLTEEVCPRSPCADRTTGTCTCAMAKC
ncbi:Zn-dependent hydrolase [Roseibium aggregatum]|uniref:N-carbamoyl-L-amino acid hydrolase n=1 Tax=Roseibium aggregatum TaxID=187304 RepID=A0A0M6YCL0_9HYPH|nr:Zn-dependent hydrolase [Roseibium aggregatum]CTQ47444.1 N-carbamoyl-L-amino acid hydrolase [Roseibium aggregatum]